MARPRNRYARAQARARYRKPKRRSSSLGWNVAIGVVVLVGVVGIVVSRSGESNAAPGIGDHWHAQLAVNVCGQFLGPAPEFESRADDPDIRAGVHTHGDGIIHIHPFASDEAGDNATVGTFLHFGGWSVSEDSLEPWEGGPMKNGDPCPGEAGAEVPGTVRFAVNGKERTGDPGDYKPRDGDTVVIAFLPEGQEIPAPEPADRVPD